MLLRIILQRNRRRKDLIRRPINWYSYCKNMVGTHKRFSDFCRDRAISEVDNHIEDIKDRILFPRTI